MRHPLVRTNPVNGGKALFLGAHASHIEGMPVQEGRALLKELAAHVTQPQFFNTTRYKRLMQRTTVSGGPA